MEEITGYIILACLGTFLLVALIGYFWFASLSRAKEFRATSDPGICERGGEDKVGEDSGDPGDPRSDQHYDKNSTSR
jgi:hypothetical protein